VQVAANNGSCLQVQSTRTNCRGEQAFKLTAPIWRVPSLKVARIAILDVYSSACRDTRG
jgi:hypothetical protein